MDPIQPSINNNQTYLRKEVTPLPSRCKPGLRVRRSTHIQLTRKSDFRKSNNKQGSALEENRFSHQESPSPRPRKLRRVCSTSPERMDEVEPQNAPITYIQNMTIHAVVLNTDPQASLHDFSKPWTNNTEPMTLNFDDFKTCSLNDKKISQGSHMDNNGAFIVN